MAIPCDDPPDALPTQQNRAQVSFEVFFRAQYPATVRLAHLLTGSDAIAQELAQDAFAQLHQRFGEVREPRSYLRTTIVNTCRNWHRRHRRELERFAQHGPTEDTSIDAVEELIDAIASLPYRQRAVLVMRYWLDLSEADIAHAIGCRPGTVKSLHSRALTAIRKELP